jgi:uncharacterized protein YbjT (DUF2867 family)
MNSGTVLVTGATGNVGLETALRLISEGVPVRALLRSPERGREKILTALRDTPRFTGRVSMSRAGELLECIAFDFLHDPPEAELFDGVSRVFLMRPPDIGDVRRYMFPFLTAARAAGAEHVVLLSLLGAEKLFFIPHRKLEKEIQRLGFRYHFLRAGFFMQNLDTVFDRFIREQDELPVPAGRGRTSFVDARDIGEAAARLLTGTAGTGGNGGNTGGKGGSGGRSGAPELTGGEAFDYRQVAEILGEELGRTIRYPAPGLREFHRRVLAAGWDPGFAKIAGRLYFTVRFGMAARITGRLEEILGRPPRSLREYIRDYRPVWERTTEPD